MTNEQKAKEIAEKNLVRYCPQGTSYEECYQSAMQAMQWKDKEHEQEKQQLIDKVCEFIEGNISEYYNSHYNDFDEMNFINDFKKAMKGE